MIPSKGSVVYHTSTSRYWLESNEIIISKVNKDACIELDDAIENEQIRNKLIGNKRRPILIDIRGIKKISKEARLWTQKSATPDLLIAVALLVGSPLTRIIGSFALGYNKPIVPIKLFTSEEDAINWLRAQIP